MTAWTVTFTVELTDGLADDDDEAIEEAFEAVKRYEWDAVETEPTS